MELHLECLALKEKTVGKEHTSYALSLNNVANGTADAYLEKDIMIWDVAAGLAIVEGAGGEFRINKQDYNYPIEVIASNNLIDKSIWAFQ